MSAFVGINWSPTNSSESFVMDDSVNGVVLMDILIEPLPFWTFGFWLLSLLSPIVWASFLINKLVICYADKQSVNLTQWHAWMDKRTHVRTDELIRMNTHTNTHTHLHLNITVRTHFVHFSYLSKGSKQVHSASNGKSSFFQIVDV